MRLVHLTSTDGQMIIAARIGYGDFVFSFFPRYHIILRVPATGAKNSRDF